MPWFFLGQGTYNEVFTDAKLEADRRFVLKVQRNCDVRVRGIDLPDRSVRLWNLINPDISPQATIENIDYIKKPEGRVRVRAWKCPYIRGRQATDHEIACELVRIFNDTGRIIADAISPKNFIRTAEGRTVCVDVGMALELEHRDEAEVLSSSARHLRRQKSAVSLGGWQTLHNNYIDYFAKEKKRYPETIKIIQTLLFIKNNNIDISQTSFLLESPLIRRNSGNAYLAQQIIQLSEEMLAELQKIKDGHSCKVPQLVSLSNHYRMLIGDYVDELTVSRASSPELEQLKVQMQQLRMELSTIESATSIAGLRPQAERILARIRRLLSEENELQRHIQSSLVELASFSASAHPSESIIAGAGAGAGAGADADADSGIISGSASGSDGIIHLSPTSNEYALPLSLEIQRMKVSCGALIQSFMSRMRETAENKRKPKAILQAANQNLEAGTRLLRLFDTAESLQEVRKSVIDFRSSDPDLGHVKQQCTAILDSIYP